MNLQNQNGDETVNTVYKTTDYNMFKTMTGNRRVIQSRVNDILKSFQEGQVPIPIVVNEKLEVADGQGRLEAARQMGLPVYYIIIEGLTLKETRRINKHQTKWTNKDFLESEASMGSAPAERILTLMDRFGVGCDVATKAGSRGVHKGVFNGALAEKMSIDWYDDATFTERDYERAREALIFAEKVCDILGKFRKINRRITIQSSIVVYKADNVDLDHFLEAIDRDGNLIRTDGKMRDLNEQFCVSYNYRWSKSKGFMDLISGKIFKVTCTATENRWRRK